MRTPLIPKALLLAGTLCITSVLYAQKTDSIKVTTDSTVTVKNKKNKKDEDKKKQSEYELLLKKGGSEMKGMFTVRHIENKWYFEIPDSLIGRYFMAVTRLSAVPQGFPKFSGEEINHATVYFEQSNPKTLLLRCYVLSQQADKEDKISRTLEKSTIDPIVASFKVIGRNKKSNKQLIDVTNFFLKDNNIVSLNSTNRTTFKLGAMQDDRTNIDTIKAFPINIEIQSTRTYTATPSLIRASQTGFVTIGLNTSLVMLPQSPMRKRIWDERIGYFVDRFTLFSDKQQKTEKEAFIARYNLVPKDKKKYAKGILTEPEKQIVYYIDPATPKQWVPYLIAGINDWNVAFEAAGFKNAIIGKEWPEDKSMDVDDARYNVIRYLPSETENAYGPHISDPRSGEIIESHICWYHNVMSLLNKWYMVQCGAVDKRARSAHFDDELMGQLICFVSSHEVGHTLGLRHNMGASYNTPVEKLRDKAWVEKHGHTVSIMDYARFNYVAQPEDGITEAGLFPRINDYDKWAIKWGYQYRPEFKDEYEEKDILKKETTNILKQHPEYWFGGEGRNEDARAQTEDLGDNNMKANEYGIKNLKRIINNLPTWTHQDNDEYEDLRSAYKAVYDQYNRYNLQVLKNLGTRYYSNMPGKSPYEEAPAQRGKEVVQFMGRNLFDAPTWLFPAYTSNILGLEPSTNIITMQSSMISRMISAAMLNTLYNIQQRKTDAYKVDAYLNDLFATVWQPIIASDEVKNKCRRALERSYLDNIDKVLNPTNRDKIGPNAKAYNSDAILYVKLHLDKIEQFVKKQLVNSAQGTINRMHYEDLLEQIKLVRERRTSINNKTTDQ